MNRVDELTDRLIDGTLTDAEAAELESLLAADPAARARHVALLDVEAALRGMRTDIDLSAATVARIEAERAERTASAVMTGLARRPPPAWDRRPVGRHLAWVALAALAAAVLVGFWLSLPSANVPRPDDAPAAPDVARVTAVSGSVELLDAGTPVPFGPDRAVAPGQTLRTVGEDSAAVVEFPDRTRIELHPDTAVRFAAAAPGEGAPRRMFLVRGQLTANVTDRPAVVATDGADVVARRGAFSLWSSGPGSVRVELREGDVRVVRAEPAEPVLLSPGGAAFVRDETTPVRVELPWRIDTTPRDQHELRALDVAFSADGREVWAATAKQLVRWRLGPDGRGAGAERELYASPSSNDGHLAVLTPDLRSLVACRVDDREDRVLVRGLPGGAVRASIPVRVSEPRLLCASPDASWVATLATKPANRLQVWDAATGRERASRDLDNQWRCLAASPDGRWLAVEMSEGGKKGGNRLAFLDPATGDTAFSLPTHRRTITAMAFGADGRFLAAGFNGAVQVWDVPGRKLLRTIEGFERVVTRLAFDPTAGLVAAGTQDGQVWVWSARSGRRTQMIQTGTRGVRALAFSPDGKTLATATNKAPTALWDVAPEPAAGAEPDL